jgi:hypothetical protein
MLQLKNQTPFKASLFVFPDEHGVDTLYVVVKATFELYPEFRVAEEQMGVVEADEYWGDPATTSLKFASEAHLNKPGTDVVVIGEAIAPAGRPVRKLDVALSVAGRTKFYTIFGERKWTGVIFKSPGRPEPFVRMPLIYERAFGGANPITPKGKPDLQPRNPVGRGFLGEAPMKAYQRTNLPNIEDKKRLLQAPKDSQKLQPVGFGFIAPSWQPRLGFAGTFDEAWQKTRAPYLPTDFNPKYFHAAHPDWIFEKPLQGGEQVQTLHLSKRIRQDFTLPQCHFNIQATVKGRLYDLSPQLETVLLMPTEEKLALTWRASLPCDKKALKVEGIHIQLEQMSLAPQVRR